MKCYETPELKAIHYDIESRVMDGYSDGNIIEKNPWEDLFQDDPSNAEPQGVLNL